MVELRGLEPLTPTLPVWCATSCAIAPSALSKLHHRHKGLKNGPSGRWESISVLPASERQMVAAIHEPEPLSLRGGQNQQCP